MPDIWTERKLGDICQFQAGDAFAKEAQGQVLGDHPFIKVSDMNLAGNEIYISRANNWVSDEQARGQYRLHPVNAVVFAKIGIALTYNRRRRLTRPTVIDNNMMSATCVPDVDATWFYYLLSTIDFNVIASGSALPYLTVKELSRISVQVPPIHTQRAIGSTLRALDDRIDLNRRMNETLEAMARAVFTDWFVDFGPTRAKMKGSTPYLAEELWALFPDRLDDEGKPEGWAIGRLDDLIHLQRGFDLPNDQRVVGEYVVMAASGPNGHHNQFMVRGPGVTTGRSGVLGNVFFIHEDFWPLNTSLWVKEFKVATPAYAYFLLQSFDVGSFNAGSAVPTLNRNHIHNLPMPVPARPLVEKFDAVVMPLLRRQRAGVLESQNLAATRDLLLPKLMSAEIRVRNSEKMTEKIA